MKKVWELDEKELMEKVEKDVLSIERFFVFVGILCTPLIAFILKALYSLLR